MIDFNVLKVGDWVKVEYTTGKEFKGGTIEGKITEIWLEGNLQGQVDNGWCFHKQDNLIKHIPKELTQEGILELLTPHP